ncbi:MAG: hypothetical protein A3G25_04845 [Betaproteobacteria bacterium RIFCSPLOWO2_12_FULL_63_13]|nr:MAG: hypothetical protein A3G25_04845 [Betaproteobacteria bacterium RIFCSPLOWO2_12_FULL_63_13]
MYPRFESFGESRFIKQCQMPTLYVVQKLLKFEIGDRIPRLLEGIDDVASNCAGGRHGDLAASVI